MPTQLIFLHALILPTSPPAFSLSKGGNYTGSGSLGVRDRLEGDEVDCLAKMFVESAGRAGFQVGVKK